jgi:hypothetical protein
MIRHSSSVVASIASFVLLSAASVFAAPGEHLNSGAQLHSGVSACPSGPLVINVVEKVLNDDDSGVAGNAWALDDFVRQIQVVDMGGGTFCATVKYQGSFTTFAGISPGGTGQVGAGVVGTFEGGYASTVFSATLKSTPGARVRGSIGTFDYACDAAFNCPGAVDWTTLYFDNVSGFDLAWWGWTYHAGNNGSWVNAISGNTGDITGN